MAFELVDGGEQMALPVGVVASITQLRAGGGQKDRPPQ